MSHDNLEGIDLSGEWWYLDGADRMGPVGIDALQRRMHDQLLTGQSLVWTEGMADWAMIDAVPELAASLPRNARATPPPIPIAVPGTVTDQGVADRVDARNAGSWRRFFARTIDLWIFVFTTALLIGLVGGYLSPAFSAWIGQSGTVLGLLLVPVGLFVEVVFFGLAGTTPGKKLLGVTVLTAGGQRPTFDQYLQRQVGVYWYGLALGLPLISLFTMARQASHVRAGRGAIYDRDRFQVLATPMTAGRVALGVLAFGAIALVIGALD